MNGAKGERGETSASFLGPTKRSEGADTYGAFFRFKAENRLPGVGLTQEHRETARIDV